MFQYHIDKQLFYLTCVQINICGHIKKHLFLLLSEMIQCKTTYLIYTLKKNCGAALEGSRCH